MASSEESFAACVRANQGDLNSEIGTKFDYIVCGAGTSGSVVAARLAANPSVSVLLLEAGGSDEADVIADPNRWPMRVQAGQWPMPPIRSRSYHSLKGNEERKDKNGDT
jgi:choline dehydrogenase-like flavoprotein